MSVTARAPFLAGVAGARGGAGFGLCPTGPAGLRALRTAPRDWPSHRAASLMQTLPQAGPGARDSASLTHPRGGRCHQGYRGSVNYLPSGEDSAQGSPASDAPVPTAAPNQGAAFLPTATVPPATLVPAAESRAAGGLCSRALCPLARSRAPPLPGGVPVPSLSPARVPRLEAAPPAPPRPRPAAPGRRPPRHPHHHPLPPLGPSLPSAVQDLLGAGDLASPPAVRTPRTWARWGVGGSALATLTAHEDWQ